MRITLHARGGFAVYGGSYDPHTNEAVVETRDGETVALTIEYPSAPTNVTKTESGISTTTPSISTTKLTTTLSGIEDGGYVDITATVGGQVRKVRVRGSSQTETDRYGC